MESEYIALVRAVIIQAARDAVAGDESAAAWLAADDTADSWFMVAGVRRSVVLDWLKKPRIKQGTKRATRTRSTTSAKITSANKRAVTI